MGLFDYVTTGYTNSSTPTPSYNNAVNNGSSWWDSSLWDNAGSALSGVGNWLGDNWQDVAKVGVGLGGLYAAGGGFDSGNPTSTETIGAPDWAEPYIKRQLSEGQNLYENFNPEFYSGNTVAGYSPMSQQAIAQRGQRANQGSPLSGMNKGFIGDTLSGNYLNANPYLDDQYASAMNRSQNDLMGQFSANGRSFDSGAFANAYADRASENAAGIYGQNYQNERAMQLGASQIAPQVAANDYADIDQLQRAGSMWDAYNQDTINEDIARWDYAQTLPYNKYDHYAGAVNGANFGTTSRYTPGEGSKAAGLLGGAALGADLGKEYLDPYTGGYGAIAGGLLGAYAGGR